MNKYRFGYFLNTVKYEQFPVSRRPQVAGPPHPNWGGMDSFIPQILTDHLCVPGTLLVLGIHKHTPSVHGAYTVGG